MNLRAKQVYYNFLLAIDAIIREKPDALVNAGNIEFPGIWEQLNNPDFNPVEFDGFRKQAGLNSFTLTPKHWIEKIHARGIVSKPGRYGGTFAHKDIAKRLHMHHIVVYFRNFFVAFFLVVQSIPTMPHTPASPLFRSWDKPQLRTDSAPHPAP